ncbi:MAG: hypothetical protein K6F75_07660 [Butyrivibrio sp.]|nr:hypothetical protein [Butyrivibrio sp.]
MADSEKKRLAANASRDLIFSILALVIYNGVLQLLIYPGLNARMGAEAFGTVLYFISVISIMGAGFGTAASYSRMVAKKDRTQANGDYNVFLLMVAGVSLVVSFVAIVVVGGSGGNVSGAATASASGTVLGLAPTGASFVPVFVLMVVTVVRYYADVEYRMTIRFVDYCVFFAVVSAGYVVGLFVFDLLGRGTGTGTTLNPGIGGGSFWWIVLLIGELSGILYTVIRGRIFRPPFTAFSSSFRENLGSCWIISASNLLSALILNADRILLILMVGARQVTVFYTASLIGKIVAMLTTPLNGVIISYFTNYKIKLEKRTFGLISIGLLAVSVIGAGLCTAVSMLFVKLMYPDVFEAARQFFFPANLGQILYFVSGSLMVIVLSFTGEKLQLKINVIYVVLFAALVVPLTYFMGLKGLAYGLVVVNALRLIITAFFGIKKIDVLRQ